MCFVLFFFRVVLYVCVVMSAVSLHVMCRPAESKNKDLLLFLVYYNEVKIAERDVETFWKTDQKMLEFVDL